MAQKHGHHGGAWKVAYADFVTAMMALFLVLWLTAQDTKIKEAIERAFRNPFASVTKESSGIIPNKEIPLSPARGLTAFTASAIELKYLRSLMQDLLTSLQQDKEADSTTELQLTPEGLRLTIFDRGKKPIFEPDTAKFTEYGNWILSTVAWQISRYKRLLIELEGHTASTHFMASPDYGNWELSLDRANAARHKILQHGVHSDQIRKIAGFADTEPMPKSAPEDEINNRVTVFLRRGSDGNP